MLKNSLKMLTDRNIISKITHVASYVILMSACYQGIILGVQKSSEL